mmetsp:Transcript_16700/g.26690  ORF Transcript_16700/g.26690 Transcript_16700/m.26690 type:complete len:105 (-) Transcript_16700:16-330(-)
MLRACCWYQDGFWSKWLVLTVCHGGFRLLQRIAALRTSTCKALRLAAIVAQRAWTSMCRCQRILLQHRHFKYRRSCSSSYDCSGSPCIPPRIPAEISSLSEPAL